MDKTPANGRIDLVAGSDNRRGGQQRGQHALNKASDMPMSSTPLQSTLVMPPTGSAGE
jgi:hypothetical protein